MTSQNQDDEGLGGGLLSFVIAVTAIDIADIGLDLYFAGRLIYDGHRGYGITLLLCTLWAVLIAILGKRYMSCQKTKENKRFAALMTEAAIYFVEDCTMIMVIAGVADAYDASDPQNIATVVASLLSALISMAAVVVVIRSDYCFVMLEIPWTISSGFFLYLLIAILVSGGLDHLSRAVRIVVWILYGIQMVLALLFTAVFAWDKSYMVDFA